MGAATSWGRFATIELGPSEKARGAESGCPEAASEAASRGAVVPVLQSVFGSVDAAWGGWVPLAGGMIRSVIAPRGI